MIGSSGRGAPVDGESGPAAVQVTMRPYIHLALLNSSIEAGILLCGNGALPRHGGRALSRACVTQLSALSFGCFSYTGSHSLLLLT
jgi:hypothetical protein